MNPLCSICFELFTVNDKLKTTQCGHIFHPKCLEAWIVSSKTCPECRKPCHMENLLAIYLNTASISDLGESEEPSILVGQLFNMKKEMSKMEKQIDSNVEEIEKLKAIVNNFEFMLQEKKGEIASLQNENESLRTWLTKCNTSTESKKSVHTVATSPMRSRNCLRFGHNNSESCSILYLKTRPSSNRVVVILDPSTPNNDLPQAASPKSQPPIDIITLEQPNEEISSLLSHVVQIHKSTQRTADSPTDFDRCFGATAFDFQQSDLCSPDRDRSSGRFDFSIFNIDPNEDPELALALKSSMEEAEKEKNEDKEVELAIKLSIEQANLSTRDTSKQMVQSFLLNLLERL